MSRKMTRRSFVGIAAVAAGGALLGGCAATQGKSYGTADRTADLVVVGSGAAGLTAAARASQLGASVLVLESRNQVGGTTALSGGNYTAITDELLKVMPERTEETDAALKAYLEYDPKEFGDYAADLKALQAAIPGYLAGKSKVVYGSVEKWLVDHFLGTRGQDKDGVAAVADYKVVAPAYRNSGEVYEWLLDQGITFGELRDNDPDGGPISMQPEGDGGSYVRHLQAAAEATGLAEVLLNHTATELIVEDGRVVGVVASNKAGEPVSVFATKAVLLATGGFGANSQMVVANENRFDGISGRQNVMEAAGSLGQGLEMATAIGADTVNTQFIQYFPNLGPSAVMLTAVFGVAFASKFVVNMNAERFTFDPMGFLRNSPDSLNQPEARYYLIGDAAQYGMLEQDMDNLKRMGVVATGDTIEEAAEAAGLDPKALAATVKKFNGYCDKGKDGDFGRDLSAQDKVVQAPFTIVKMRQAVQNTMGGLVIDEQARVLDMDGNPIEGLYAAGEVTGVFDGANRRHGDNYAQIFYYGYKVGEIAAQGA